VADSSAVLLARLRAHISGGRGGSCRRCNPARGIYCPVARPDAEAFAAARREEVFATRVRRIQEVADRDSERLLAKLRRHMTECRRCDPGRAIYCARAQPDAEAFARSRGDEVLAARRVGRRAA